MILASLRELTLREGLVEDPSFESKPVRWVIELKADGRFRQAYDTNEPQSLPEGSKKKPKPEARLMAIPRRCMRASGIKANFLVDNAKYVLGEGAEADEVDPKNVDRHVAFRKLLDEAQSAAATPEPAACRVGKPANGRARPGPEPHPGRPHVRCSFHASRRRVSAVDSNRAAPSVQSCKKFLAEKGLCRSCWEKLWMDWKSTAFPQR